MKITDATLTLFAWDNIPATTYGAHTGEFQGESQLGLLRIATDQGIEGHAFLGSSMHSADQDGLSLIKNLKPLLIGEDPLDRERLYQGMLWRRRRGLDHSRGGGARHRPVGHRRQGLPTCRSTGSLAATASKIPVYCSSDHLARSRPRHYADEAVMFKERWLATATRYIPTGAGSARTSRFCRAVRDAVGRRLHAGRWISPLDHFPRRCCGWAGLSRNSTTTGTRTRSATRTILQLRPSLKQKLDIPILATERGRWRGSILYTPAGSLHPGQPIFCAATSPSKAASRRSIKTAHLAEAFGMNYEVHVGGNPLNNIANLHVTMAIRNCEYFEVLLPEDAQKYGLSRDIEVDANGLVHAPTGPGLGAAIDFDLIERKKLAVLA